MSYNSLESIKQRLPTSPVEPARPHSEDLRAVKIASAAVPHENYLFRAAIQGEASRGVDSSIRLGCTDLVTKDVCIKVGKSRRTAVPYSAARFEHTAGRNPASRSRAGADIQTTVVLVTPAKEASDILAMPSLVSPHLDRRQSW